MIQKLIKLNHNWFLPHIMWKFFRLIFSGREQILFTEKIPETQSTKLYSLYDFEKRDDKSIEKGYQLGRYGGIPNIKYGKI